MKRIIMMLTVAALLVVALTFSAAGAFAAPNCAQVPNNPNCKPVNPGGQQGGCQHNPNCEDVFKPGK
jgi:hypothetical protein